MFIFLLFTLLSFNLLAMDNYEKLLSVEGLEEKSLEDDWVEVEYANPLDSIKKKILLENNGLEFVGARIASHEQEYYLTFNQKDDLKAKQVEFMYSKVSGQIIRMKD